MKNNNSSATTGKPRAGRRVARLTMTTKHQREEGARPAFKTFVRGELRLGNWATELDDPFALGAIAHYLLASRVELFNGLGERLARDICAADIAEQGIAHSSKSEAMFLHLVVSGFTHRPLVLHVLPPKVPRKPAPPAGSNPPATAP